MYNLTVHASQVLDAAMFAVSVTETDDTGATHVLFTVQRLEDLKTANTEPYTLERYLDQVVVGLSRALSVRWTGLDGSST